MRWSAFRDQKICQRICAQCAWPTAGGSEAEGILDRLVATCPKVEQMDVTGCTFEVVLRAVRTRHALSAASPLELYVRINTLQEEEGGN